MARIELVEVAHSYHPRPREPDEWALRQVNTTWRDGGAHALLGPSGCGKTTLLNIISGLLRPTRGRVLFDGKDVTDLPPEQRNIAQVFQFPVVYEAMSVFDNLAFPLRNRRAGAGAVRRRVQEVAEILELTGELGQRAGRLGPEVRQKVSLGRGLVREDVAALLLDEPFTVIDPHLKWLLRRKLKQIHQQLALSLVYVTHDQVEALTFADQVVVMTEGQLVQTGTAQELFEAPAHTFVGHFVGHPGMNLLPCTIDSDGAARVGELRVPLPPGARDASGPWKLGIRPEFVECSPAPLELGHPAELLSVQPLGSHTLVGARLAGHTVWAKLPPDDHRALAPGRAAWLRLPPERILLYANERRVS